MKERTILSWQITSRSCCKILAKLVCHLRFSNHFDDFPTVPDQTYIQLGANGLGGASPSLMQISLKTRENLTPQSLNWGQRWDGTWAKSPFQNHSCTWLGQTCPSQILYKNWDGENSPFKTTRAHGWDKPGRLRFCTKSETAMLRRRKFTFQNHSCTSVQGKLQNLRVICVLKLDGLKVAQKIMLTFVHYQCIANI